MNADVLQKLAVLLERDRQVRDRLLAEDRLYGLYDDAMQAVHRDNARELDRIVERHGWPGVPLVGLDGSRMAWRIAQHANCTPDLQRKFLTLMRQAVEEGGIPARQVAFLTDRILFNEGKPLLYGTVLDWNGDGELSCDLADPANLDARRQAVGLPPYDDDLRRHREEVRAEGGRPPADLAAYRRRGQDWAEAVGWRPTRPELKPPEPGDGRTL